MSKSDRITTLWCFHFSRRKTGGKQVSKTYSMSDDEAYRGKINQGRGKPAILNRVLGASLKRRIWGKNISGGETARVLGVCVVCSKENTELSEGGAASLVGSRRKRGLKGSRLPGECRILAFSLHEMG